MYCRICGDEHDTQWRASKRNTLCAGCDSMTPRKASKRVFDRYYWGKDRPGHSVKREVYSDYLASAKTLQAYKRVTTGHPLF